jgi:Common central domain of tyrosinase
LDLLISGEILGAVGFADFADYLEIIHGAPHNEIGGRDGDMSDGRYSPADPIFYLHHATIDRIWAEWQAAGNGNEFNGVHRVLPRNAAQQAVAPVSVDEVLGPARWGRTVQETLEGEPSICVSYTGVGGRPVARMAMQTKERQAGADGAGYSTKEVKERVETQAAKKKASDGKAYKEACAEIIESRKTFYAGAEFAGFKKEFIDAAYSKKKFLDTAANGVLLEDVEDPEAVVTKPTKDVESEGRVKYEAVNTQSAGVVDTASSPPLTKPTAAPTAWYAQAGDEYYGA